MLLECRLSFFAALPIAKADDSKTRQRKETDKSKLIAAVKRSLSLRGFKLGSLRERERVQHCSPVPFCHCRSLGRVLNAHSLLHVGCCVLARVQLRGLIGSEAALRDARWNGWKLVYVFVIDCARPVRSCEEEERERELKYQALHFIWRRDSNLRLSLRLEKVAPS